jgi:hypothetical protein
MRSPSLLTGSAHTLIIRVVHRGIAGQGCELRRRTGRIVCLVRGEASRITRDYVNREAVHPAYGHDFAIDLRDPIESRALSITCGTRYPL